MKIIKLLLLTMLLLTAFLQLCLGIWIIIDTKSVGKTFIGSDYTELIQQSKGFTILRIMLGQSFIMLSIYSITICILIIKNHAIGIVLALITGLLITNIGLCNFFIIKSYTILLTDFCRGLLIFFLSFLALKQYPIKQKESI